MLKATLDALAGAIKKKPPFCSGTLPVSPDTATLYYKSVSEDRVAKWIDLSKATSEELRSLADICQPATFGLGERNVLDETYRKAGKLDCDKFSTKLDVVAEGIIDRVHLQLLDGVNQENIVRSELYKLNVYGEDSFFKSHKDTPRGGAMFGSLVIVFPTPHEGGALLLRHNDQAWTFDSALLTREAPEPSIAYIAFYSDVEHEVTVVQSGYRVTLTYNLFFEKKTGRERLANSRSAQPVAPDDHFLRDALSAALDDQSFLPEGGYLGFGLDFKYPIDQVERTSKAGRILKGSDAVIDRVCRQLSLKVSLNAVYDAQEDGKVLVSANCLVHDVNVGDEDIFYRLLEWYDGKLIQTIDADDVADDTRGGSSDNDSDSDCNAVVYKKDSIRLAWVTPMSTYNGFDSSYIGAFGNEAESFYIYGNLCIVAEVGPFGQRTTLQLNRRDSDVEVEDDEAGGSEVGDLVMELEGRGDEDSGDKDEESEGDEIGGDEESEDDEG